VSNPAREGENRRVKKSYVKGGAKNRASKEPCRLTKGRQNEGISNRSTGKVSSGRGDRELPMNTVDLGQSRCGKTPRRYSHAVSYVSGGGRLRGEVSRGVSAKKHMDFSNDTEKGAFERETKQRTGEGGRRRGEEERVSHKRQSSGAAEGLVLKISRGVCETI